MRIAMLCILVFCSVSVLHTHAQDTTWYGTVNDNSPRKISSITIKTDSGWRMVNYSTSGKITTTGLYADDSCTMAIGNRSYYTASGKLLRRVHFDNGKAAGSDTYYYENDHVLAAGFNRDGAPDGEWTAWYRNGRVAARAIFADGRQTTATFFNPDGTTRNDTHTFFQESTYPGGMTALYEYLDKNLQYPASAFVYNVQGVVVLQFRITKEGHTMDLSIVQPVDPALDKEAFRVVSGMQPWEPATIGGVPVDTYKRLPIQFKQ